MKAGTANQYYIKSNCFYTVLTYTLIVWKNFLFFFDNWLSQTLIRGLYVIGDAV